MPQDFLPKCTFLVNQDIKKLTDKLNVLPVEWERFSIGYELSKMLIIKGGNRTIIVNSWITDTLIKKPSAPVICTDIDLLFEPMFVLDPFLIFKQISRHTKLIILWPGEFKDNVLSYGIPLIKQYRFWRNPQNVNIIGVNDALQ